MNPHEEDGLDPEAPSAADRDRFGGGDDDEFGDYDDEAFDEREGRWDGQRTLAKPWIIIAATAALVGFLLLVLL